MRTGLTGAIVRRVTTPDRAAIEAAAKQLELVFPTQIADAFEGVVLEAVDPAWALTAPEQWERLRPAVKELFGKEWTGLNAAVIGEDQDGNFVCLVEEGDEVGVGVHLLDQGSLGLELIAEDVGAWLVSITSGGAAPGAAAPADDEPLALLDRALVNRLLGGPVHDPDAEEEEPEPEASPQLLRAVDAVLDALIAAEAVELEDDRRAAVVAELCTVVGEARSPKDFMKRFVRTVVHSDHVEEVYGTDNQLRDLVKGAMDPE